MAKFLKDLKVVELKRELEERGLETSGVKNVLILRLREALEQEGVNPDEVTFEDESAQQLAKMLTKMEENSAKLEMKMKENSANLKSDLLSNSANLEMKIKENSANLEMKMKENSANLEMKMLENSANLEMKMEENSAKFSNLETQMFDLSSKLSECFEQKICEVQEQVQNIREEFKTEIKEVQKEIMEEVQKEMAEELKALEKKLEMVEMKNSGKVSSNELMMASQMKLKPPEFDGKSSWSNYLLQFNAVAINNNWSDKEKATALTVSLRGDAADVLQCLPVEDLTDYDKLVKCLETRFNPEQCQGVYHYQLKARRQKSKETIQEYHLDIMRLTRLAYPDTSENTLERLGVQAFEDGLRDEEVKQAVALARSKTMADALRCALEFESVKLNLRNTAKVREMEVSTEESPDVANIRKIVQEVIRENREDRRVQCWFCGMSGHVQRWCRERRSKNAPLKAGPPTDKPAEN